jgi:hypothetical protein
VAGDVLIPPWTKKAMDEVGKGMAALIGPLNDEIRGYTAEEQTAAYIEVRKMKFWQHATQQLQMKQDAHQQRIQINQIRKLLTARAGHDLQLKFDPTTGDFTWPATPSRKEQMKAYLKNIGWDSSDLDSAKTPFEVLTLYKQNLDTASDADKERYGSIETPVDYTVKPDSIYDTTSERSLDRLEGREIQYTAEEQFEERALYRRAHILDDPPTHWDGKVGSDDLTNSLRESDQRGYTHASDPPPVKEDGSENVMDGSGFIHNQKEQDASNAKQAAEEKAKEDAAKQAEEDEANADHRTFHQKAVDRAAEDAAPPPVRTTQEEPEPEADEGAWEPPTKRRKTFFTP